MSVSFSLSHNVLQFVVKVLVCFFILVVYECVTLNDVELDLFFFVLNEAQVILGPAASQLIRAFYVFCDNMSATPSA